MERPPVNGRSANKIALDSEPGGGELGKYQSGDRLGFTARSDVRKKRL
jgi:hypothetical protein